VAVSACTAYLTGARRLRTRQVTILSLVAEMGKATTPVAQPPCAAARLTARHDWRIAAGNWAEGDHSVCYTGLRWRAGL